jgi:isopentenyl-diphosphate delta-isomerase
MVPENQLGVKTAAIRKLEQELGIPPEDVPIESFQYLTRVHYKVRWHARVSRTLQQPQSRRLPRCCCRQAASDGLWGEHEVDYILICRPGKRVRMRANPNEVSEIRAFGREELRAWAESADERSVVAPPVFRAVTVLASPSRVTIACDHRV